jgi:hypothetical protein
MADLVGDHARQLILVPGNLEDAGVDADLAARQRPGIRLAVLEHGEFPALLAPRRRQLPGHGLHHASHIGGLAGIPRLRRLLLGLGEGLLAKLVQLLLGYPANVLLAPGRRGGGGAGGQRGGDGQAEQYGFGVHREHPRAGIPL